MALNQDVIKFIKLNSWWC